MNKARRLFTHKGEKPLFLFIHRLINCDGDLFFNKRK